MDPSQPIQQSDQQNYTDIQDLALALLGMDQEVLEEEFGADAFDQTSWGKPERESYPAPQEKPTHIEMHEAVEHEPDAEVSEYIEEQNGPIQISDDLKELGVQPTHVVQYPTQNTIEIPLEDDEIVAGLKKPLDSGFRWLAEVCLYLLRKAHIRLKIAHGKAERIYEK